MYQQNWKDKQDKTPSPFRTEVIKFNWKQQAVDGFIFLFLMFLIFAALVVVAFYQ